MPKTSNKISTQLEKYLQKSVNPQNIERLHHVHSKTRTSTHTVLIHINKFHQYFLERPKRKTIKINSEIISFRESSRATPKTLLRTPLSRPHLRLPSSNSQRERERQRESEENAKLRPKNCPVPQRSRSRVSQNFATSCPPVLVRVHARAESVAYTTGL